MHRPSEPENLRLGDSDQNAPCNCACATSVKEGTEQPQSNRTIVYNADWYDVNGGPGE